MFNKFDSNKYYKRNDKLDPRLGDLIVDKTTESGDIAIMGYPDDDGIQLNKGRIGAALAPEAVRFQLSRMTAGFHKTLSPIIDLGDLSTSKLSLEKRHEFVKTKTTKLYKEGLRVISIGGGHDYGYPDAAGFLSQTFDKKPLVINFDAHLDVRPTENGLSSGTPFYRLLTEFENFDFAQIGIQQLCNTKSHYNFCQEKGAKIIEWDEYVVSGKSFTDYCVQALSPWLDRRRPCFVSIDIDVFSSAFAMGCSQSWPHGLTPQEFMPLYSMILKRMDVQGLGIYEVSPPLDLDNVTSKLAAQIIYHYIQSYGN